MPCDDVTEELRLKLDHADRLLDYELIKVTCGRAVGERSLLAAELAGLEAQQILAIDADIFADARMDRDEVTMFLEFKHLFAVQGALKAMLGREAASAHDAIAAARVVCEADHVMFEARIAVDVVTEQIKACGRCKGCGTKRASTATAGV